MPARISAVGVLPTPPLGFVTMTLTAQQIKDVLEQQFTGCRGQVAQRIMQISNGFKYTWNPTGGCDTRITDVSFTPTDLTANPAIPTVQGPTDLLVINGVVLALVSTLATLPRVGPAAVIVRRARRHCER